MQSATLPASALRACMRSTCCAASFAAFCEDACPTEAIVMEHEYELSFYDRASAIYTKDMLLVPPAGAPDTPQQVAPGSFNRSIPDMQNPD